ncbi:aminopeptidase O isoform X2 [Oryzias melastigma]|uniref:aminopeptidase O isoform X2 n=1 Tax=Oryzias melastigma TaxID=30732 RepID=UPI000CF7F3D3|nr:aminopeptidase O isoform X2 [Oryzias melastigma]
MEPPGNLDPDKDDLPLRANTNHILVKHYVLDLTVHLHSRLISSSIVLFLEPQPEAGEAEHSLDGASFQEADTMEFGAKVEDKEKTCESADVQTSHLWQTTSSSDFTLVLDCCDLDVSKVEEVDITSTPDIMGLLPQSASEILSGNPQSAFMENLFSMPSSQWQMKHQIFSLCSRAPCAEDGSSLPFHRDLWSLQVRKRRVESAHQFPRIIRIHYQTKPSGSSLRWTKDQDNKLCVYTAGSPINNRALFPCQEPPVAMSTWQATVRAPSECVVLMSGEEQAVPTKDGDTHFLVCNYYVTMPMPASTFTLAVGHWHRVTAETFPALETEVGEKPDCGNMAKPRPERGKPTESRLVSRPGKSSRKTVKDSPLQTGSGEDITSSSSAFSHSSLEDEELSVTDYSAMLDDGTSCSHSDYPCRFTELSAWSQRVIPHRVFSPVCLLQKAQMSILKLLPCCLAAAHAVLGVHPFPRLDVLIVPAGFSSLGMASPHIVFLSQSVLDAGSPSSAESSLSLCGSRICHEIAHSWFGLVIGARDWTEEWISEGFATCLEDTIWAQTQKFSSQERSEQFDLKALLRWRRLSDEMQNSKKELQILRPNMEKTGQVSESGSSTVKHALNPEKTFMQVHYLKGYFLLRFLASEVGEQEFIDFLRMFVRKYHGHLVLSQDFLQMFLTTFSHMSRKSLTLADIYTDWLDRPGIPEWLHERSAVWSHTRLVEEVREEVIKWILFSRTHQGKGRKRKRLKPKTNFKEVSRFVRSRRNKTDSLRFSRKSAGFRKNC